MHTSSLFPTYERWCCVSESAMRFSIFDCARNRPVISFPFHPRLFASLLALPTTRLSISSPHHHRVNSGVGDEVEEKNLAWSGERKWRKKNGICGQVGFPFWKTSTGGVGDLARGPSRRRLSGRRLLLLEEKSIFNSNAEITEKPKGADGLFRLRYLIPSSFVEWTNKLRRRQRNISKCFRTMCDGQRSLCFR